MKIILFAALYCLIASFIGVNVGVEYYKQGLIVSRRKEYLGFFKASTVAFFWPITLTQGFVRWRRREGKDQ